MNIAASIQKFFSRYKIRYQVLTHSRTVTLSQAQADLNIPSQAFARSILLGDEQGYILAVLPLASKLNISLVNRRLKRRLKPIEGRAVDKVFNDCEPGSHPIFGELYGLRTIMDVTLARQPYIYFEPGTHTSILRITQHDFHFLQHKTVWAPIGTALNPADTQCQWQQSKALENELLKMYNPGYDDMAKCIEAIYPLPPLPNLAHEILALIQESNPNRVSLVELIESDPNLTEWVIQYVRGLSGKTVADMYEAIDYLGVERSGQIAVGVVAGRIFQVPNQGPLGLEAFWEHAFSCAQLCRALSMISDRNDLVPSKAFLCGLMHNFGILLFAHFFVPEFKMLNKMVAFLPNTPIEIHEQRMLGLGQAKNVLKLGHAGMGAWLLKSWSLPPELVISARHHHDFTYQGEHAQYVRLLMVANAVLKEQGLGDGFQYKLESMRLEEIGLSTNKVERCLEERHALNKPEHYHRLGIAR